MTIETELPPVAPRSATPPARTASARGIAVPGVAGFVTPAARVLRNLHQGKPAWCHLRGRSMYGGAHITQVALRQRDLVEGPYGELRLTALGRMAAAWLDARATPLVDPVFPERKI